MLTMAAGFALPMQKAMAEQAVQATQQANAIKGQVLDKAGEPIIGATVKVKGTNTGTITDIDGNFTLSNVNGGALW